MKLLIDIKFKTSYWISQPAVTDATVVQTVTGTTRVYSILSDNCMPCETQVCFFLKKKQQHFFLFKYTWRNSYQVRLATDLSPVCFKSCAVQDWSDWFVTVSFSVIFQCSGRETFTSSGIRKARAYTFFFFSFLELYQIWAQMKAFQSLVWWSRLKCVTTRVRTRVRRLWM